MNNLRLYALHFTGLAYKWGGESLDGMDCSGFVQELLASCGADPPGDQTAQSLFDYFSKFGSWNVQNCGALIFFGQSAAHVTHVAMMIDQYRMIEAGGGGPNVQTYEDAVKAKAFVRVRPIVSRKDRVAIIMPHYPLIGVN